MQAICLSAFHFTFFILHVSNVVPELNYPLSSVLEGVIPKTRISLPLHIFRKQIFPCFFVSNQLLTSLSFLTLEDSSPTEFKTAFHTASNQFFFANIAKLDATSFHTSREEW